ncbi:hypothetical protein CC2G_007804 [Coprinopsis cinerea AmutBmut pab1-1]|nr:hypothetical protein CC2G_007804 [Coprinopsis cinerea AmutBmut pab1-1]
MHQPEENGATCTERWRSGEPCGDLAHSQGATETRRNLERNTRPPGTGHFCRHLGSTIAIDVNAVS